MQLSCRQLCSLGCAASDSRSHGLGLQKPGLTHPLMTKETPSHNSAHMQGLTETWGSCQSLKTCESRAFPP